MALGLAARRGVAEMIGRMYRRADVEADLDDVDGDGPPAPSFAPLERDPDSSSDDGFPSDRGWYGDSQKRLNVRFFALETLVLVY